jgi:hypothetical protein
MDIVDIIKKGDHVQLKEKLSAGFKPNQPLADGLHALHWSAVTGQVTCAEVLLKQV